MGLARRATMRENMARYGTQYRWTKAQRIRSGYGRGVDYNNISKRFLEHGALSLCSTCARSCKIPSPSIPVRFTCYDYIQAGEEIPKPSEKTVAFPDAAALPSPPPNSKERK